MGPFHSLLGEDCVPFVPNALRDVSDRISVIQKYGQNLSPFHCLQLELGFDEVVGTDHSSEVQLCVRLDRNSRPALAGWIVRIHSTPAGRTSVAGSMRSYQGVDGLASTIQSEEPNVKKKGQRNAAPYSDIVKILTSTYCRPFTRFGFATSVP